MFFELEDVKRRHSVYWDLYNVEGWVTSPDSNLTWNYQRGWLSGILGSLTQEIFTSFHESWRLLSTKYEPPANLKQFSIYVKEIFKMDNYKKALKNRSQYALCAGGIDIASRIAAWRWVQNGWQVPFGGFEFNFIRKILPGIFVSALTAPLSVPFEIARMTYYADKTYPKHLQKGYKSFFNTLFRIPFEEGPYWFYKNSFPFLFRNFMQTFTLFYTYDWLKDKMSFIWRVGEVPYLPVKLFMLTFSSWLACIFSYPWAVTAREMVDFWPKEKGGKCTWNNNYRQAAVWLWYHDYSSNFFPGFFNNYFWKCFPWMFASLFIADNLGIFSYQRIDITSGPGTNTWEDSFI